MFRSPFVLAVAALAACGDGGPVLPAEIQKLSGDGQVEQMGGPLAEPLKVRVIGSDGQPYAGGTVLWRVASGDATVGTLEVLSDANGEASTVVTLGPTEGQVVVEATLRDVASVTFTATSRDPCYWLRAYTIGLTITGTLGTTDCDFGDGTYVDFYEFSHIGGTIQLTETASVFDAWLWLFARTGHQIGYADDGAGGTNSLLKAVIGDGFFVTGANSLNPGETGPYTLSSTAGTTVSACEDVWIAPGAITFQSVAATDCVDPSGAYGDFYLITLYQGESRTITMQASAFAARLVLYGGGGTVIQADTAAAPGDAVGIFFIPSASAVYGLFATTAVAATSGDYTLVLNARPLSAPLTLSALRPAVPQRLVRPAGVVPSR